MTDIGISIALDNVRRYQTDLSRVERSTNQATGKISNNVSRIDSSFQAVAGSIPSIGAAISSILNPVTLLSGALVGAGAAISGFVSAASDVEDTRVQFATLVGDAELARLTLQELTDFAAGTPFQLPDINESARLLIAFGEDASTVTDTLRRIGDVSAGVGAPLNELAEIYGKIRVQNQVYAEDLNQLSGRGIPIIQELADQFGVAEGEIKKLASTGQIEFSNIEQAFASLTAEGGRFNGLTESLSQTLSGQLSTFRDNIGQLSALLGEAFLPFFKEVVAGFTGVIQVVKDLVSGARTLGDVFGPIGVAVENFADAMEGAFVSLGNLLNEVFVANSQFGSFLSILNDIGQFVIGVLLDSFTRIARVFSFVVDTVIQIRAAFQGLLDTFLEVTGIGELFEGTLDRINNFFNNLLGGTADAAQGLSTFAQVLLNVRGIASGVFAAILQVVDNWASAFIGYLGGVGDLLAGIFTFDLDRIEAGFNAVTTSVGDATVRLFDGVRQAYDDGFAEVFNSAQDAANEIRRTIGPQVGVDLARAVKEGVASEGVGPIEVGFVADNIALLSSIEPIQASLATIPDTKVIDIRIDTDEDGPNSLEAAILRIRSLVNDLPSQLGGALDGLINSGIQSAIQGITNSFVELGQGIGESLVNASAGAEKIKGALRSLVSIIAVEVPKIVGLILIRSALDFALAGVAPVAIALAAGGLALLGISGIASGLLNRAAGEVGAGIPVGRTIDFSGSIQSNSAAIVNNAAIGLSDQAAQPLAPNVNVSVLLDSEEIGGQITRQIEIQTRLTG